MNSAMISILLPCILLGSAFAAPHTNKILMSTNPWEEFEYAVDLDVAGKYWMFWTPDDNTKTITFEVHVEALGYVGFGISPNGGMTGADVVIGWVKDDGTAVFHDRHALGEYEPIIDESQDVTLLSANQNDTHTILRFSRPYVTCEDNDRDITADTIRVIFSFTDTDPEDITGLDYHGSSNRGTKSVILLNYNEDSQSLPDDAFSLDILISENTIPRKRTTYWCEFLEIPQMEEKHHVVMFEPVIQPGNEGFVHHIAVYACYGEISDDSHGQSWDCIWNVMPDQHKCSTVMFVWAVGGNPFYFPEHAGVPFFTTGGDSPSYVRIEMHYDNPAHIEGITDHSGIRIHMTPTLREYDIGVMTIGADVSEKMIIPPHYNELTMRGHCTSDCFGLGLNTTDDNREDDHMNVFAVYQHSHLLGRKMKTRLYRDGAELQPLMNDEAYDFNFQETRMLKEERQVYLNDLMVVDCGYDSSDKDDLTKGGLATKDEMCVVFVYYYPAHDIISCLTLATQYQTINAVEGIKTEPSLHYPFFRITAPPEFAGMEPTKVLRQLDWTSESQRKIYQDVRLEENTHMTQVCVSSETGGYALPPWAELSPELGDDWIDPDDGQCSEVKKIKSLTNPIN